MTGRALLAETSLVHVVLLVAPNAVRGRILGLRARAMAATARNAGVPTAQREMRIGVVVELNLTPAVEVMAVTALGTITSFMHIVGTVTVHAHTRHFVPQCFWMTRIAGDVLMPAL